MFEKSGSVVSITKRNAGKYLKQVLHTVKRADTGKEMLVPAKSLVRLKPIFACPYCDRKISDPDGACCGKKGHRIAAFETQDHDIVQHPSGMNASSKANDQYYLVTGIVRVTAQVELRCLWTGTKYYFKASPNLDALKEIKVGETVQIKNGSLVKKHPGKTSKAGE